MRLVRVAQLRLSRLNYRLGTEYQCRSYSCLERDRWRVQQPNYELVKVARRDISGEEVFMKMSNSKAVAVFQEGVLGLHEMTGLPWWATLSLATVAIRLFVSFPVAAYQAYIGAKLELVSLVHLPVYADKAKVEAGKRASEEGWDHPRTAREYARLMRAEYVRAVEEENCHPAKISLPVWVQLPIWICLSTAIRNLVYCLPANRPGGETTQEALQTGGALWFVDLTLPDPTFILPVLLGVTNLLNLEMVAMTRMRPRSGFERGVTNVFRLASIAFIPLASVVPSAVCLYWTVSSMLGVGQNLLLMSPRLRSNLNIAETPTSLDRPYLTLAANIAARLRLRPS